MNYFLDEIEAFSKSSLKEEARFSKILSKYEKLINKVKEIHTALAVPGETEIVA
jgi:hypothetical protein